MKLKGRLLVFSLIGSCLLGCDNLPGTKLLYRAKNAQEYSYDETHNEEFRNFIHKINTFGSELSENLNKNMNPSKTNSAFSPASIFYALGMLSKITSNTDKANLLNVLGVSNDELNKYMPILYSVCNTQYHDSDGRRVIGQEKLDNSIWLDEKYHFNDTILNNLANIFSASSYSGNFEKDNENMNQSLSNYVYNHTNHMLKPQYDFGIDTVFVLLNTLFFENVWNEVGDPLKSAGKQDFKNFNGATINKDFYKTEYVPGKIYSCEEYDSMYAKTYNNFRIEFRVPHDGYTVEDIFTKESINKYEDVEYVTYYEDDNTFITYFSNVEFPEFEASFDNDILDEFYTTYKLNKINDFSDFILDKAPFEVSSIIHTTKVEVKKDTIKGAAATAIGGKATAVQMEVTKTLKIDRSFVYTIKDPYGIKLFEGVIYNV